MVSPSQRRTRQQRHLGLFLIVIVVSILGAIIWFRLSAEREIPIDESTLCPKDGNPRGYFALLFDASDPVSAVQKVALERQFSEIVSRIPEYHRVRVFVIQPGDSMDLPAPSFDRCKPQTGRGASKWTQNPEQLKIQWQEGFEEPLRKAIEDATKAPAQHNSPIMELIQAAALESFPASGAQAPRELVVVSDFLQHTPQYSHYGVGPPRFDDFVTREYARKVYTDLSGVSVLMLYLRRDRQSHVQGREHQEFWKRFFVWSGIEAHGLRIVPIEG